MDEILEIIREECELSSTPAPADALADLGADSMAVICAIQALEDRFGIEIPLDVDLAAFRTVGDLAETVRRMAEEAAEQPGAGRGRPEPASP